MWSNFLDSDTVKNFVEFGTELIKIVDDVGLLKVALMGVGMYLTRSIDFTAGFSKPIENTVANAQSTLADLKADMDAAVAEDATKKTKQSSKKAEEATQRYNNYKTQVEEIEAEDLLNKKAQERIDLQEQLNAAQDKYESGLEKLGGQDQDPTMAMEAWDEMDALQKKIDENGMSIDDANARMQAFNNTVDQTGKKGITSFNKLGKGLKKVGKQLVNVLAQMAAMYAITTAIDLLGKGWKALNEWGKGVNESPEEAQEKFEELNSELSQAQLELRNLESELDKTNDRMDELMSMGTLSFVEQEELNNLQKQSKELENQITLAKTLEETLQNVVALAAINASQKTFSETSFYSEESKEERAEEAKENGTSWGQAAGLVAGGLLFAALVAGGAVTGGATTAMAFAGGGALLGGAVGGAVGQSSENAEYDSEKSVTTVLNNMAAERAKLEKARDEAYAAYVKDPENENLTKQWEEAQSALGTYDATLAQHISQMQQYVNSIDPDSLTNPADKAYYEQMKKWVDTYAIMMGGGDAKVSVIERLFGEDAQGGFAVAKRKLDEIYAAIEQAEDAGDELALATALSELEQFKADQYLSDEEIAYLREYGLTVYETEQYFISQKRAAEEAIDAIETYDAVKNIQKLTSGVNDLKNAFKELYSEGIVSAETLMGLNETFGQIDGFKELFETLSSGTVTMEKAQDAVQNFAEKYIDQLLGSGELNGANYTTVLTRLQQLGVTNAQEFLDAKIKKDMIGKLVNKDSTFDSVASDVKSTYGIVLDVDKDRLLVEKAITTEKTKQQSIDTQNAKNAYDTAKRAQEAAINHNAGIDTKINYLSSADMSYLQNQYGVGTIGYTSGQVPRPFVRYNGKTYYLNYDGSPTQELRDAIAANLAGQKVAIPSLPVQVTQIDVDNANNAATTAANALQTELNEHGLAIEINLLDPNELIDDMQNTYDTLANAAKEYGENGYVSVDTLQSLLQLKPKYLELLYDENGQLNLNKDTMYQLTVARVTDMGIQQAQQVIENARTALLDGNIEKLKELTEATYGQASSNWSLVTSNLALLKTEMEAKGVDGGIYDSIEAQVLAIQDLTNTTIANIGNTISSSGNTAIDAAQSEWEKLVAYYENQLALISNERDLIEAEIDKAEARGGKASAEYYEDLIRTSAEEKTLLEEQYAAMKRYLDANKDTIDQDTWTEYNNALNDIAVSIKECETNTIQWQEALREIDIHYFEQATAEISRLGKELDFVNSILEDEEVSDENGNWSSAALTRMGMYMNQIEAAAADTQRYQDEIAKLNQQYAAGELSEEQYQNRLAILTDGLYDSIEAQNDARDGILELNEARIEAIKEGIEKEIEAYEDLIDAQKEELEVSRDLYDFKNKIKKQTKDIAALERRIASLSGSSAAADVAERRRLEAQLLEAKEGLNDEYYNHSQDAQQNALDSEAESYKESQERRIEELEKTLDDVELLIQNSMLDVLLNADIVYNELNGIADTYGVTLSEELRQPWNEAADRARQWKSELEGDLTSLTGEGGAITLFSNGVSEKLAGSWDDAKLAVKTYSDFLTGSELGNKFSNTITGFANQIQQIIDKWTGVKNAADSAYRAQVTANSVGGNINNGNGNNNTGYQQYVNKQWHATATYSDGIKTLTAAGTGSTKSDAEDDAKDNLYTAYYNYKKVDTEEEKIEGLWQRNQNKVKVTAKEYAKGTTGTSRDQWAITDELGDELVLVPTAQGNLSYMRKGTSVVPAQLTANLMAWGQFTPDSLNLGGGVNVNMINNAVIKPQYDFNFDSLVHVDNCSQETLKDLEKMVDNKIDKFSKDLNYSIKRFAR